MALCHSELVSKAGEVLTFLPGTQAHTENSMETTGQQTCDGGPVLGRYQLCGSIFN